MPIVIKNNKMKIKVLPMLLIFISLVSFSTTDLYPFQSSTKQQQFNKLLTELRCLVCQNESLADSNADLALDLKKQIYQRVQQGKSNEQITQYLVSRYGEFVLFKPPLEVRTYLLWLAPLLMLIFGGLGLILFIVKRGQA